jgi:phosphoribosylformimino-5-aminoimidazole carboxamide ribonucleotide (ProFAR) isomerase
MKLTTLNGHNEEVINNFNKIASKFEATDLLDIILTQYCDDGDLIGITEHLKDRLIENNIPI